MLLFCNLLTITFQIEHEIIASSLTGKLRYLKILIELSPLWILKLYFQIL